MIFLDTSSFIARYIEQDSYHKAALRLWGQIGEASLSTSNHVLDETFTLLARRAGYRFAAERAERIYASDAMEILYSTREDETNAIALFRKYSDQGVSFTDCVSFVLMKRLRIPTAFTFDRHFAHAGFRILGLE